MNRKKKLAALILLMCFMLSACTSPNSVMDKTTGTQNAGNAGEKAAGDKAAGDKATGDKAAGSDASDNASDDDSDGTSVDSTLNDASDVSIVENYTGGGTSISVSNLGSTTFNIRESESALVTETFPMEGPEKSIQLRDEGNNMTWKLTVPEGALLNDTEIKMTLLYNISGSEATGELDSGVMLEPDGLDFIKPATLTAEGDYEYGFAYSARQDGTNLDTACAEIKDGNIALSVSHFSMYALKQMTQEEFDKLRESEISKAEATLKEAIEEAKKVVKEPIMIPPLPTWSKCLLHDEESEKTRKAYDELDALYIKLASPEYAVLQKMAKSASTIALCGGKTTQPYENPRNKLSYRLYKKAQKVLKEYGANKENIIPAINLSMHLLRDSTWSPDITSEMSQAIFKEAGLLALQASRAYLDEIIKNHDYCSFSAAWSLARAASLFNYDEYKNSPLNYDSLVAAMKFKFAFDGKIYGYSKENHTNTYTLNAKIPDVKEQLNDGKEVPSKGSGEVTAFESTNTAHMKAVLPTKFEIDSFLDFHYPCEEEPTIVYIDKPAPLSMTYYLDKEAGETMKMPFFKLSWLQLFQPHLSTEKQEYHIEMKMVNGQASHKLDMTNSVDFGKIEYQFNLEHIPE